MMKKACFLPLLAVVLATSCGSQNKPATFEPQILSQGITFCESVLFHNDELLVANFGTAELNPLNTEGKGYILAFRDTASRTLVPCDGHLSAPKGMLVKENHLFVCDVNKLLVYDLSDTAATPQIIAMPEGEVFVNDLALQGNTLYITVTNTGNIYTLDAGNVASIDSSSLALYTNVVGANGILVRDSTLYVASYPADGVTSTENLIYIIRDLSHPAPTPLIDRMGQYDGLALDPAGEKLYFSSWVNGEVGVVDLRTKQVSLLDPGVALSGPARMILHEGKLYLPDLPGSRVVVYSL